MFFKIYEKWIFTFKTISFYFHNSLYFVFIASFAFVLQMLRVKPIPLILLCIIHHSTNELDFRKYNLIVFRNPFYLVSRVQ